MRLIRGGAPGASLGEMWTAIRDNPHLAAPCTPSEIASSADIHAPMPPSRAHIRRLKRNRPEIGKVSQFYAAPPPLPTRTLPSWHDFLKEQLRVAGVVPPPLPNGEGKEHAQANWQAARDHRFFAGGGRKPE